MALFLATRALRPSVARSSVRLLATQTPPKPPPPPPPPSSRPSAPPSSTPGASSSSQPERPLAQWKEQPTPGNRSMLPSLDFDPASSGGRTGAKSSANTLSSFERRRKFLFRVTMGLFVTGIGVGYVYMGREWEENEANLKKESQLAGFSNSWTGRANARLSDTLDYFNKPIATEILPTPPLKPYTLLLSLDDLLITSTWDREHGWRTAKRPGVDYFLAYLSQFFEIAVFTSQYHYTALPICEQLDPYGHSIAYRLPRDYTRSIRGKIVKDLTYLNRDLSKVILLDTHPDHVSAQPENAIILPKWTGDPRDKGLVGLIPFLESIGIMKPGDVRPVLTAYEGKDIATTYAQLEAEHKKRFVEQWQKKREGQRAPAKSSVGRFTASTLFSGATASDPTQPPPTYLELKRMEAQEFYRREQQFIRENEEEWRKQIAEEKAKEEQISGTLLGVFTGANWKPPEDRNTTASPREGAELLGTPEAGSAKP